MWHENGGNVCHKQSISRQSQKLIRVQIQDSELSDFVFNLFVSARLVRGIKELQNSSKSSALVCLPILESGIISELILRRNIRLRDENISKRFSSCAKIGRPSAF